MSEIELFPYSLPALTGGGYQLDVWHAMSSQPPGDADLPTAAASATTLVVTGPSLKLEPSAILAGFPAPGEAAATPDRLPYLVFQQETLPWMYRPAGQTADSSHQPTWLALVALKESELNDGSTPPTPWQSRFYPARPLSEVFRTTAQQVAESASVDPAIGSPADLCDQLEMPHLPLWTMVPTTPECGVTAHVRRLEGDEIQGDDDGFVSILLGTRQLEASTGYHLFLLSLQARDVVRLHQLTGGSPPRPARFVVLYHTTFRTGAASQDFREKITGVDLNPWGKGRRGVAVAKAGSGVLLNRQKRDGSTEPCLYHGPLVDRIPDEELRHAPKVRLAEVPEPSVPVEGTARPDISYRAAFELGRLMALSERSWLSALLDYRRTWQHRRAWETIPQTRLGVQAEATAAALRTKKSIPQSSDGMLKKLIPVPGLETVLTGPIDAMLTPARLSAATVSDKTGLRHLVGRGDVPGLDPATVAREKYGLTAQPNAMTVSSLDSTTLTALVGATTKNLEAAQALRSESAALPPPSTGTKKSTGATPSAASSAPLVDGSLLLKGAPVPKSKGTTQPPAPEPPETLLNWLFDLCLLRRVPFPYLVPHAELLPAESMRLFYLDAAWIAHLVDGALGAAVTGSADAAVAEHLASRVHADLEVRIKKAANPKLKPDDPMLYEPLLITGVLLRSSVVRQTPNLGVRAYAGTKATPILRRDSLSGDCLLVLFYGMMDRLELHEPAEGLRYGATLRPNSRAEVAWQDPAGVAADRIINFAQWDAGAKTLDLGRNTPGSMVRVLQTAVPQPNAHHVAWALQRDPFVYRLDRGVAGGTTGTTTTGATGSTTSTTIKDPSITKGEVASPTKEVMTKKAGG